MEVTPGINIQGTVATLQWGHDKIVMEVPNSGIRYGWVVMLQWGHDKIVMEVSPIASVDYTAIAASMGP